jgi:hypothetical protein
MRRATRKARRRRPRAMPIQIRAMGRGFLVGMTEVEEALGMVVEVAFGVKIVEESGEIVVDVAFMAERRS